MRPTPSRAPGRPYVLVNMAMTADGKIATAGREVHSFGSSTDLAELYRLRSTADAILCGARTLEETRATLGNGGDKYRRQRLRAGLAPFPLRVVVSGRGTIAATAEIWKHRFSPIVVLLGRRVRKPELARLHSLADHIHQATSPSIDFSAAFVWLEREFGVRRIVVEGGGALNAALFRAGLVDELRLTWCPYVVGGRFAPTVADGSESTLAEACQLRLVQCRQVGRELFLRYTAR